MGVYTGRRGWARAIIMQREDVVRVPFMHEQDKAIDAEDLGMKLLYRSWLSNARLQSLKPAMTPNSSQCVPQCH